MDCRGDSGPDGESLVVLGMAASIQLAQGLTLDEIELLSAFFEVLGDNLALIAARRASQEVRQARRKSARETEESSSGER